MTPSSGKLNDKVQQDEAQRFSIALLRTPGMLSAYAKVLAQPADTPDDKSAAANKFIQNKSENGVDNYNTTLAYVLQAQQTMQTYMLIYWSGFYKTQIGAQGSKDTTEGESFVIAATLDSEAPVHIGVGRNQIISPTFANLILKWEKSSVQVSSAELVFNLVPDQNGNVVRTFAGTYDDGSGQKLFTGIAQPQRDQTSAEKDKEKFSLPPALQVIFPVITAIGAIVGAVGGTIGLAWVIRQWKDRNAKVKAEQKRVDADPDNPEAKQDLDIAKKDARMSGKAVNKLAGPLEEQGQALDKIPPNERQAAGENIVPGESDPMPPNNAAAIAKAGEAVQQNPGLLKAAAQLSKQAQPDPVVRGEGGESGEGNSGIDSSDGILSSPKLEEA